MTDALPSDTVRRIDLPVIGTFAVADGKIAAWRDYFDLGKFMSQMPQA